MEIIYEYPDGTSITKNLDTEDTCADIYEKINVSKGHFILMFRNEMIPKNASRPSFLSDGDVLMVYAACLKERCETYNYIADDFVRVTYGYRGNQLRIPNTKLYNRQRYMRENHPICSFVVDNKPIDYRGYDRITDFYIQPKDLCYNAIDDGAKNIQFVFEQTEELCDYAMNKSRVAIKHIRSPTNEQLLRWNKEYHDFRRYVTDFRSDLVHILPEIDVPKSKTSTRRRRKTIRCIRFSDYNCPKNIEITSDDQLEKLIRDDVFNITRISNLTEEIFLKAALVDTTILKSPPEIFQTADFYKKLIELKGLYYRNVPRESRTDEIRFLAVKQGFAFVENKTEEMWDYLYENSSLLLKNVQFFCGPGKIPDKAIKKLLEQGNFLDKDVMKYISPEMKKYREAILKLSKNDSKVDLDVIYSQGNNYLKVLAGKYMIKNNML